MHQNNRCSIVSGFGQKGLGFFHAVAGSQGFGSDIGGQRRVTDEHRAADIIQFRRPDQRVQNVLLVDCGNRCISNTDVIHWRVQRIGAHDGLEAQTIQVLHRDVWICFEDR